MGSKNCDMLGQTAKRPPYPVPVDDDITFPRTMSLYTYTILSLPFVAGRLLARTPVKGYDPSMSPNTRPVGSSTATENSVAFVTVNRLVALLYVTENPGSTAFKASSMFFRFSIVVYEPSGKVTFVGDSLPDKRTVKYRFPSLM
eukprot:2976532-Prorocentrum_lima.AAC.1